MKIQLTMTVKEARNTEILKAICDLPGHSDLENYPPEHEFILDSNDCEELGIGVYYD